MNSPKRNSARKSRSPTPKKYVHQGFFRFAKDIQRKNRVLEILQQHRLPMTSHRFYPHIIRVRLPNANVRATFNQLETLFERLGLDKQSHLMQPNQESQVVSRKGFDFPERAIAKKRGKIRSEFFYDHGEFACAVHRASLRAGPNGSARARDEVWIDIQEGPFGEFLAKSLFKRQTKKPQ